MRTGPDQVVESRLGMDPRMQRRRSAIAQEQGRRRLRVLLGGLSVAVVGAAGWLATLSPLLDVDRVSLLGGDHTTPGQAASATGIRRGQPLVDVRPARAVRRLERLPWVAEARVDRHWPGTVQIRLSERRAVAMVASGRTNMLVDGTGRLLAEAPPGTALPVIVDLPIGAAGPGARLPADGGDLLAVAAATPGAILPHLAGVAPATGGGVELRLRRSGVVRFGRAAQVEEKMAAVATVLARVDITDVAVLDVRIPSAPALTRLGTVGKVSTRSTA